MDFDVLETCSRPEGKRYVFRYLCIAFSYPRSREGSSQPPRLTRSLPAICEKSPPQTCFLQENKQTPHVQQKHPNQAVKSELQTLYGKRLAKLILYGSYARGDQHEGSDIDFLVVLKDDDIKTDR